MLWALYSASQTVFTLLASVILWPVGSEWQRVVAAVAALQIRFQHDMQMKASAIVTVLLKFHNKVFERKMK